ncbi:DoxX family protein [Candidatus Pacearchaeota archaeon]|nr:DoxX family protein [Candidatus Pacearchaeota archaeon]
MENNKGYGLAILRIVAGLLFLLPGIMKLMDPAGITGMLTGLGFPAPSFLAWILLLSEIIFGASLIVGWKTKYTTWPLVIVLLVATLTVALPGALENPMGWVNVLFHLVGIGALISIFLDGPGAWAVSK